jgi:hypothetical protein
MEAVRTVIMAESDSVTVPLPAALRNRRVEVIVLPAEEAARSEPPNGDDTLDILRKLAERNAGAAFGDPLEWQKNEK